MIVLLFITTHLEHDEVSLNMGVAHSIYNTSTHTHIYSKCKCIIKMTDGGVRVKKKMEDVNWVIVL